MRTAIALVLLTAACGCSVVRSPRPIGEKPTNLADRQDRWAGTWLHSDGSIQVGVEDASNGVLRLAWIDSQGGGDFTCRTARLYLRDSGPWTYASLREVGAEPEDGYVFGRVMHRGKTILAWMPDYDRFRELVNSGVLPGTTGANSVVLGELVPAHYERLRSDSNGVLFVWDSPLIFQRVGD